MIPKFVCMVMVLKSFVIQTDATSLCGNIAPNLTVLKIIVIDCLALFLWLESGLFLHVIVFCLFSAHGLWFAFSNLGYFGAGSVNSEM